MPRRPQGELFILAAHQIKDLLLVFVKSNEEKGMTLLEV
jgi:hypothetical protein